MTRITALGFIVFVACSDKTAFQELNKGAERPVQGADQPVDPDSVTHISPGQELGPDNHGPASSLESSRDSSTTATDAKAVAGGSPVPDQLKIVVPSNSIRAGAAAMQVSAFLNADKTPTPVIWSVRSVAADEAPGMISIAGLYTPPDAGGGYDVIITARLPRDPEVTDSIVVAIVAPEEIFVACHAGNAVFPITASVFTLPVGTKKLPDFAQLGDKTLGVCMDAYNVTARSWSNGFPGVSGLFEWFALRTTTKINAATAGNYAFRLNSDDGSKLYIDGQLVINNDGQHGPLAKEGSITLSQGAHDLLLDYFQGPRYQIALELFWKTPGTTSFQYVTPSAPR